MYTFRPMKSLSDQVPCDLCILFFICAKKCVYFLFACDAGRVCSLANCADSKSCACFRYHSWEAEKKSFEEIEGENGRRYKYSSCVFFSVCVCSSSSSFSFTSILFFSCVIHSYISQMLLMHLIPVPRFYYSTRHITVSTFWCLLLRAQKRWRRTKEKYHQQMLRQQANCLHTVYLKCRFSTTQPYIHFGV